MEGGSRSRLLFSSLAVVCLLAAPSAHAQIPGGGGYPQTDPDCEKKPPIGLDEVAHRANNQFVDGQIARLEREIGALRTPADFPVDWMVDESATLLRLKQDSLVTMRRAKEHLGNYAPGSDDTFRDALEVREFVKYADNPELIRPLRRVELPSDLLDLLRRNGGYDPMFQKGGMYKKGGMHKKGGMYKKGGGFQLDSGGRPDPIPGLPGLYPEEIAIVRPMVTRPDGTVSPERVDTIKRFLDDPSLEGFYRALGKIPVAGELPPRVDLSERFERPRVQGETYACGGFAFASDMGSFPDVPQLSAGFVQSLLAGNFDFQPATNYLEVLQGTLETDSPAATQHAIAKSGTSSYAADVILREHGIPPETAHPTNLEALVPEDINAVRDRRYVIDGLAYTDRPLRADDVRRMLAGGITPVVQIDTDARDVVEDWVRPTRGGSINHIFNVVGYDTGVDPFDLQEKPYFVVRDSYTPDAIHYRMSADDLIRHFVAAYKVTGVKTLATPHTYERRTGS